MTRPIARRTFLSAATLSAATLPMWPRIGWAGLAAPTASAADHGVSIHPFSLEHVRLRPGPALEALKVNRRYLMDLEPDRLLHTFRITARLPTSAAPLGGWEAPDN